MAATDFRIQRLITVLAAALACLVASACGGGGGSAGVPETRVKTEVAAAAPRLPGDLDKGSGLRGFNLAGVRKPALTEKDYADLAAYGANLVRIGVEANLAAHGGYEMAAGEWQYLQTAVDMGRKFGFKVVVTLTAVPWGEQSIYWDRPDLQQSIVGIWSSIAARFKGDPVMAGYDLINEPVLPRDRSPPSGPNVDYWREFSIKLVQAIRNEDAGSIIIFEPSPWGLPHGFSNLTPLPFARIVYSFHFYSPHELTVQGLYNYTLGLSYPSATTSKYNLSREMEPVRAFAKKYSVPIYVGEFSIVRWAPGDSVANYLTDVIDLIETEGWNWSYHAYREYEGWDAEIEPAPLTVPVSARSANAKTIKLLVSKGFSKNP